jgi:hypothetical protein
MHMHYLKVGIATMSVFCTALFAVLLGHDVVDQMTCAPGQFWSGTCYDVSVRPLLVAYENFSAGLVTVATGAMTVFASSGLNRVATIRTTYVVGVFFAFVIAFLSNRYDLAATASIVGLIFGMYLQKKHARNVANTSP